MKPFVLIWGGGDLASGVAIRLYRVGIHILVVETAQPTAVRRSVAFAQAVYDGETTIEGTVGRLIGCPEEMLSCWKEDAVPVMVDPELELISVFKPLVLVDGRMRKTRDALSLNMAQLVVGLGPGFTVGENCHAAIETNRGHFLGRVYWQGSPQANTGIPGKVEGFTRERVLYAPIDGIVQTLVDFGDHVQPGDPVLMIGDQTVKTSLAGVVRGLIHPGIWVKHGTKVADIDPRPEDFRCRAVSEKALAIGGGVLEAILTKPEIRAALWNESDSWT
jgi:xanthine dehydrogenase accessory factor